MSRIAVVAYPTLAAGDLAWMESIRRELDPKCKLIRGHFTLVFPMKIGVTSVVSAVRKVCQETPRIQITRLQARAVSMGKGRNGCVFLVPSAGVAGIRRLHRSLMAQLGKESADAVRDYLPHITVAAGRRFGVCKMFAHQLTAQGRNPSGTLQKLTVLQVKRTRIVPIVSLRLLAGR